MYGNSVLFLLQTISVLCNGTTLFCCTTDSEGQLLIPLLIYHCAHL